MIVTLILKGIGVDLSKYTMKELSSMYDNLTFSSMEYVLDDGKWYKKASYKPNLKTIVTGSFSGTNSDDTQSIVINILLTEVQEVKLVFGAVAGDLTCTGIKAKALKSKPDGRISVRDRKLTRQQ
ncbi:hypothetical protein HAX54_032167 [Datura stramonium]|uniref:Uncharacterized protein n=1 Tax=Datura stramonium TaxID=4076 RepID=A0ABS8VAC2_DATST|nr:hypothetical protein [Datura stramonium]